MKDFLSKLKTIIVKKKDTIFAVIVAFILHIFVLSLINTYIVESLFAYNDELKKILEEEKNKKDDYMFLVETPDVEEEENNEDTPFASDKSLVSRGQIDVTPSKVFSDASVFSFLGDGANSPIVERRDNITPNNNNNNLQKQKDLGDEISRDKVETYKPKNPGLKGDTKIPASFEDGADRAVVLSSETGSIQLGTKAQEYFWYFYTLVGSIRDSWYLTIPNQAHFLGLLRTDEVEVLISIDLDGNIIFEKFLSNSKLGQSSLDNSCSKAIEYAKKLKPPPQGLVRDYAENGKIYIPFKFIYQNFSRE